MDFKQKRIFTLHKTFDFNFLEEDITLTRTDDGYCDITQLRRRNGNKLLKDFKNAQDQFLNKIREEIKGEPIRSEGKNLANRTFVHEKILERVLRFYEVDEKTVIDVFVKPDNRIVKKYKYNKVEIMMHLESDYVNATQFCPLFGKKLSTWLGTRRKGTQAILKEYAKAMGMDRKDLVKTGLGDKADDRWIPFDLLIHLAIWCSPQYACFVGKVMKMYHRDQLALAQMAIKEYDRQTGKHSVGVVLSADTAADKEKLIAELQDKLALIGTENKQLKYDKEILSTEKNCLELDKLSYREQLKPVHQLMNDHNIKDIGTLAESRKKMLDTAVNPLNDKIEILTNAIAGERIKSEQLAKELSERNREFSVIQSSYDLEVHELRETIFELRHGNKPAPKRKPKAKSKAKTKNKKSALSNTARDLYFYSKIGIDIQVILEPNTKKSTKIENNGFTYLGTIEMDGKQPAVNYLMEFANDNKSAYKTRSDSLFTLLQNDYGSVFEGEFTEYFGQHIKKKSRDGYTYKTLCDL